MPPTAADRSKGGYLDALAIMRNYVLAVPCVANRAAPAPGCCPEHNRSAPRPDTPDYGGMRYGGIRVRWFRIRYHSVPQWVQQIITADKLIAMRRLVRHEDGFEWRPAASVRRSWSGLGSGFNLGAGGSGVCGGGTWPSSGRHRHPVFFAPRVRGARCGNLQAVTRGRRARKSSAMASNVVQLTPSWVLRCSIRRSSIRSTCGRPDTSG